MLDHHKVDGPRVGVGWVCGEMKGEDLTGRGDFTTRGNPIEVEAFSWPGPDAMGRGHRKKRS